jgi:hypothetical protein
MSSISRGSFSGVPAMERPVYTPACPLIVVKGL